jgi:hypothetical protein
MGMAADKMLAAGKDLAKVEAALDEKGLDEVTPKMAEKAARYCAIAEDLAARFRVIEYAPETPEQRHYREVHDGTLTVIPPGGDPREQAA